MNKGKYIIVSGCSFTSAYDSRFDPDIYNFTHWPEILAAKSGKHVINLAKSGMGNEYIYTTLVDQICKMDPADIYAVIPAWSESQRQCWSEIGEWYSRIRPTNGDMLFHINKSLLYYHSLQTICNSMNINCLQLQMLDIHRSSKYMPDIKPNYYQAIHSTAIIDQIDLSKFMNPPWDSLSNQFLEEPVNKMAEQDWHPNLRGHLKIAGYVYDKL